MPQSNCNVLENILTASVKKTTDEAATRSKNLAEIGERDSGSNRMRLRIWEQLNPANALDRKCPYCGESIGIEMLMNGSVDIDHIIPYSRCLDDSVGNKVVSSKNQESAKLYPGQRPADWKARDGTAPTTNSTSNALKAVLLVLVLCSPSAIDRQVVVVI